MGAPRRRREKQGARILGMFDPVEGKQWMHEILLISLASASISEAISWLLIYRKPSYIALVDNLEKEQKKLDRWKDEDQTGGSGKGRTDKSKKIKAKDARVKDMHRELQMIKMTSS